MLNPRERFLALSLLTLAACQTRPAVEVEPEFTTNLELFRVNPRDVAVLPVEDASPGQTAAPLLEQIRGHIDRSLILRRYSPLHHDFVDAALVDAAAGQGSAAVPGSILENSYLGRVAAEFDRESAVLAVRLNRWDESALLSQSRVGFQAEAVLVGGSTGAILWSGRITGSVKAGGEGPSPLDPDERSRSAAAIFVEQLLLHLPSRQL